MSFLFEAVTFFGLAILLGLMLLIILRMTVKELIRNWKHKEGYFFQTGLILLLFNLGLLWGLVYIIFLAVPKT